MYYDLCSLLPYKGRRLLLLKNDCRSSIIEVHYYESVTKEVFS